MSQLADAPPPSWAGSPPPEPPSPRPSWAVPLRVLAVLLTVFLLGSVAVLTALSFFARHTSETRVIPVPVTRLEVRTDVGDVRVVAAGAGESLRVVANTVVAFGEPSWSADVRGSTLDVRSLCDDDRFFGLGQCGVDLVVHVPPTVAVDVRTGTGQVTIDDVAADVRARSDTGDVRLRGTTGAVVATSSTGDVSGSSLSGSARASTDTGDVRLRYRTAPQSVDAESTVGEILILVPPDETLYRVSTDSSVGETRVDVPVATTSPRTLTARTDTGNIRILGA